MTTQRVYTAAEGRRALATGKFPVDVPGGRVRGPRGMNKLEARFAQEVLEPWKRTGHAPEGFESVVLDDYGYERVTLKLADRLRYTADFDLVLTDGDGWGLWLVETKGFWRDDARVKVKAAAELFPHLNFLAARYVKRQWVYERFEASALKRSAA